MNYSEDSRNRLKVSPVRDGEAYAARIHFLPTGCSDAILLESGGRFALVDCAEDTDNPRGFENLIFKGYEDYVLDYLKKHAAAKDGKVRLDFILGTHAHSDHLGGFDTVIADGDVFVGRAYLKRYDETKISLYEREKWDNAEVYEQTVNVLNAKGVPIIEDITETEFQLGELNIKLFNTEYDTVHTEVGENDNAIGLLAEYNGFKVFLAADIDNKTGDEDRLAEEIGRVDVLKVGHHSYSYSTTDNWLETLMPKVCVVTNDYEHCDKNTLERIKQISRSEILVTGEENGVIVQINSDSTVEYFNNID